MANRHGRLTGARVLVVEDEFFIADDLAKALRRSGAQPIGPVGTVEEARHLFEQERPDAVILDVNLRGEIPSTLVNRLAADRVPCLVVSGYGENSLPDAFRSLPRLEKPVVYDRVTEILAQLLDQAGR